MTDRKDRPPVEGLSEIAWARVERGVFARLDDGTVTNAVASRAAPRESRRGWLWLAVPTLAAAAAALVFFVRTDKPVTPASDPEPARVIAGASPSEVTFDDVHVALDPDTALVMPRDANSTAMLEHGAAWFTVAPRGERAPFVVMAGDTVVRVIGTKFRVAHEDDHAEVTVDHGVVEVSFHGSIVRVAADQTWSSEQPNEVGSVITTDTESEPDPTPAPTKRPVRVVHKRHVKTAAAPVPAPTAPAADPDYARYMALVALEPKQPEAAIDGYLKLSQGTSKWAANALYAAARLALDRHDQRAETLLTIYLRRFPNGANADDAARLLDRIKTTP